MDETLFQGSLKGGATVAESRVLRALARVYRDGTHDAFISTRAGGSHAAGYCRGSHGEVYAVTLDTCQCKAFIEGHGMICRHRVALADRYGMLDRFVPDFYERFSYPSPMTQAAA